jgi:hypothetical protein
MSPRSKTSTAPSPIDEGERSARLVPLRMLKAVLMNREVERGHALDEDESRQVVSSL